jgi:hypothetical protein
MELFMFGINEVIVKIENCWSSLSEVMGTQMNTLNPLTICSNSHTQTDKSEEPKIKKTSVFLLKQGEGQ